jgi:hypothetical protein
MYLFIFYTERKILKMSTILTFALQNRIAPFTRVYQMDSNNNNNKMLDYPRGDCNYR